VLNWQRLGLHSRPKKVHSGPSYLKSKRMATARFFFERLSRDEVVGWPKPRITDLDEVSREVILGFHNR
jgi:hypothetical protein